MQSHIFVVAVVIGLLVVLSLADKGIALFGDHVARSIKDYKILSKCSLPRL